MSHEAQLFIFSRKEALFILFMGSIVTLFFFTLGVHYGKQVGTGNHTVSVSHEVTPVKTLSDQVPSRPEINEQGKGVDQAVEKLFDETLQQEVQRSKVSLSLPKQVDLPEKAKAKNAGATTIEHK